MRNHMFLDLTQQHRVQGITCYYLLELKEVARQKEDVECMTVDTLPSRGL